MKKILLATTIASLATTATAGDPTSCSTLAIDTTGSAVTVDVSGSIPMALTVLLVGETTGETVLPLGGLGDLTLGLEVPFIPIPIGSTDLTGDLSLSFENDGAAGLALFGQAVSFGLDFGSGGPPEFGVCESNVVAFDL